jgi:hypothetical protein
MPLFGTSPQHQSWLCTGSDGFIGAAVAWALHVFSWSVKRPRVSKSSLPFD